jgi:hypothetical protein
MKRNILFAASLALILVSGCVITSVYPFYTAQDEVFDPALTGTWGEGDTAGNEKEHWNIARSGAKAYLLTTIDKDQTNHYEAHLFRLKQRSFLDVSATNRVPGQLPLHYLLQVETSVNALRFQLLDFDWLSKLLEKNPRALRHLVTPAEPGDNEKQSFVLTADTAELQKFIVSHLNDTNAFTSPAEMKRWH